MQPVNHLAWQAYRQVCDQVRLVWAGWPPLDMAAVQATLERLGLEPPDWSLLLDQLRLIHQTMGQERTADGQPG